MINLNTAINRLAEVRSNEDIKALSYAKFPGTHCPLFGVAMIASFISDLVVLVVGTGECTYYSKGFAYNNQKGKDNFYSLVIGKNDLTFGCGDKVMKAIHQIEREEKPAAIMVVTTCVLEVIGEDIEGLFIEQEGETKAHLLLVKTEHFKCGSHIPGMERALTSLIGLMKKTDMEEKSINILGHRKQGVENTEVICVLEQEGINIHSIIPSNCTISDIEKAASAGLNVVTDFTALPLARLMEKRLSIPYVYFGRHLSKERIDLEYKKIEEVLGIHIISHLEERQQKLLELEQRARELFSGKSFIYGNTPMMAFEVSDYLCSLGLIPLFIQVREYYEEERQDMDQILTRGYNPYISQIANISPMQEVYDILKPNIYLGHENPMALHKKGIVQITTDEVTTKIGYEVPIEFLNKMIAIYERAVQFPEIPVGMISMAGLSQGGVSPMGVGMMGKGNRPQSKGIDSYLEELAEFADKDENTQETGLDKNGLTPEMARAVAKGMPLAIAKLVSKGGHK